MKNTPAPKGRPRWNEVRANCKTCNGVGLLGMAMRPCPTCGGLGDPPSEPVALPERVVCPVCGRGVAIRDGRIAYHGGRRNHGCRGQHCPASGKLHDRTPAEHDRSGASLKVGDRVEIPGQHMRPFGCGVVEKLTPKGARVRWDDGRTSVMTMATFERGDWPQWRRTLAHLSVSFGTPLNAPPRLNVLCSSSRGDTMKIDVSVEVPLQRVFDVFVNALDTGVCNYWSKWRPATLPEGFDPRQLEWLSNRDYWTKVRQDYFAPFLKGCGLRFVEREDFGEPKTEHVLDLDAVRRGLHAMSVRAPKRFGELLSGEDDAHTADVFVQCCLFGEVKYG